MGATQHPCEVSPSAIMWHGLMETKAGDWYCLVSTRPTHHGITAVGARHSSRVCPPDLRPRFVNTAWDCGGGDGAEAGPSNPEEAASAAPVVEVAAAPVLSGSPALGDGASKAHDAVAACDPKASARRLSKAAPSAPVPARNARRGAQCRTPTSRVFEQFRFTLVSEHPHAAPRARTWYRACAALASPHPALVGGGHTK